MYSIATELRCMATSQSFHIVTESNSSLENGVNKIVNLYSQGGTAPVTKTKHVLNFCALSQNDQHLKK